MNTEEEIDSTERLTTHVALLVTAAKEYLSEQSKQREAAMEYYSGVMKHLPVQEGKSSFVSTDVRAVIKKVMPSIMRTIFGGGDVVKYLPLGPDDEEGAEQATDYVNNVSIKESHAEGALHDAIHDALLLKTGILKWCAYRQRKVTIQEYTDQPDEAVMGLFDDINEISNYSESEETDPEVLALNPDARRHTFKLRRVEETITPKIEAIPRGSFLITPGAESIEEAELVGEEMLLTRSELVSMGYDREQVWRIPRFDGKEDDAESQMGDDYTTLRSDSRQAQHIVQVWEVYVRLDLDDDGIAEVHRLVFADGRGDGQTGGHIVLGLEAVDEAPYASVVMERDPHQFEGHSIFEDIKPIQDIKTALFRATLNNLYAQNELQPFIDYSRVENPDAVTQGGPVLLKPGTNAAEVVQFKETPFVADKSFQMLEYLDTVSVDRTGITDQSGGLEADKLHNISATAALLATQPAIAQADAIVRSLANGGIRKAFRGLLRLVIAHSDGPRTVQMKGEWVQYDPKVWNMDMDCTVNVGLGGGSKERDMAVLQVILGLQTQIMTELGPDNPLVKPDQLYNTLEKITETAGFVSADPFFTSPDPQEVQAKLQAAANAPNPDVEKIKAQGEVQMQIEQAKAQTTMQLEQGKLQVQAQTEQMKAEVARDKERAQAEADLAVRQQEAQLEAQLAEQKMRFDAALAAQKLQFEREKLAQEREIALLQIGARDSENGTVMKEDDRHETMLKTLQDAMGEFTKAQSKPRRVVRDENGDIVGVEQVN
jgi:hypothetical protein